MDLTRYDLDNAKLGSISIANNARSKRTTVTAI
jgi:hypothetical protein